MGASTKNGRGKSFQKLSIISNSNPLNMNTISNSQFKNIKPNSKSTFRHL
ncbi:hypothetical protein B4083_0674 [Bacillus cereus]|nr:hypothetical protein B4083_0674 [Bacillus cereus]